LPLASAQLDDVNISVQSGCSLDTWTFEAPGQTETDPTVLPQGETGFISGLWVNRGNSELEMNVNVTVTREGDVWEPGEDIGVIENVSFQEDAYYTYAYNESYNLNPYWEPNSSAEFMKGFTALPRYPQRNYTARANITYSCDGTTKRKKDYANFIIVTTTGESGGVNTANNTGTPVPEDINGTGDLENATIADEEGNEPSDATSPAQSDQRNESAEPQEGNADSPGNTPEPEPEPEPKPEPRVEIDIEPLNSTYHVNKSQYGPVSLRVDNVGDQEVNDIQIRSLIPELRPGWEVRNAEVASLSPGENVTRNVFVRPPEDADPGLYVSPVVGKVGDERVDIDYFTVQVHESDYTPSLVLRDAPRSVTLTVNDTQNFPLLLENNGERDLSNVTARLQNFDQCGETDIQDVGDIGVNQTESLSMQLETAGSPDTCNATLIVSSSEGAYTFSNIDFSITPEEALIPREHQVPFVAIVWTALLGAFAVLRKRFDMESLLVKLPLIMLMMGETAIILYLLVSYYGLFEVAFLPF